MKELGDFFLGKTTDSQTELETNSTSQTPLDNHLSGYSFLILVSRKACWTFRIGSFYPKLRYLTDQNGPKGGPHENEF